MIVDIDGAAEDPAGGPAGSAADRAGPGPRVRVDPAEVEITAVRSQGAGGQNVNKVSSAIHLRFDIAASSLPEPVKERLRALQDQRISREGVVVIKAQRYRSQDMNRAEAFERLQALVDRAASVPRPRRPTRPTRSSQLKRVDEKVQRGRIKALRGRGGGDGAE